MFLELERGRVGRPPITIDEIADLQRYRLASSSRGRGWSGVTVDVYPTVSGLQEVFPALDHHMIGFSLSAGKGLVQRRAGQVYRGRGAAGTFVLAPAGLDSEWDGEASASARLRVAPSLILSASEEIGRRAKGQVEIRNVFEGRDPMIERIVRTFLDELDREAHPTQRLIAEAMSCALAAHLLRHYNGLDIAAEHQPPPLGRAELSKLTDYIEDNLDRSIGLSELAGLVNVSRFHFARLFKRSTGVTAITFVEQCRIRRAQALIVESDLPLVEIALMTGFADQSHFTRRFHRQVGSTPAVFAREHGRRRATRRAS